MAHFFAQNGNGFYESDTARFAGDLSLTELIEKEVNKAVKKATKTAGTAKAEATPAPAKAELKQPAKKSKAKKPIEKKK